MAKYDVPNFIAGFGEGLLSTINSERDRKQKELEFQQRMDFENRQLDLMNIYRMADLNKPFETKTGDVYPTNMGQPNFEKPLWTMPQEEPKSLVGDIEGSYKNDETGTYFTYDKNASKFIDTGIKFDRNEGRSSSTTNNITPKEESPTPYINFETVDEMVRNYNQRTEEGINMGGSVVKPDQWRIGANKELDIVLKDAGISQEVTDKIWEMAKINDSDDPVKKRKKLKNVIDQQTQLPDHQRRALYQMAEIRTR